MTKKDRGETANSSSAPGEVEELYQGLLTTSQTVIFVVQDGKFVYVNLGFEHRTGYKNEELVGKDALELVHPDDREMVRTEAIRRLKGEEDSPYEYRFIAKDGSTRWGMEKVTSITYQGKKATLVNSMDITERKNAEYGLVKQRRSLANIMATIPDSLLVLDKSLCMKRANRSFYEMFKTEPERILGKKISEVLPDGEGKLTDRLAKLLRTEDTVERFEITYRSEQVGEKILSVTARGIIFAEEEEEEEEELVVLQDITERKKAEEKLWKSERRFRRAFEANPDLTFLLDKDGVFVDVNKAALEMLGFEEEEIIGSSLWDAPFLSYEARRKATESFERRKEGEEIPTYPLELRTKDGKAVYVEINVGKFEEDGFEGEIAIARDVTERKEVEEKYTFESNLLNSLLKNADDLVYFKDREGHYLRTSRAYRDMVGLDVEGKKAFELYPEVESRQMHEDDLEVMEKDVKVVGREHEVTCADGTNRWLSTTKVPRYDDEGNVTGMVGISRDITDRKKAEMQLRESEEKIRASLEEKETLLREIHHRVKNNLQIVSSLLKRQGRQAQDETLKQLLRESENRVRSMSLIHEKLYRSENLAAVNFRDFIKSLTRTLSMSYSIANVVIKPNVEDVQLPIDTAIPCGLIVNELVSNSLKYAFPEGRAGEIEIALHRTGDSEVELVARDNGVGMPEDIDIRNTDSLGMDLVTMLGEKQLGGKVELDRSQGTEFRIRFQCKEYNNG